MIIFNRTLGRSRLKTPLRGLMAPFAQTGFTLVELSIVLVIIGLLIGGILVAQSMVGTAKMQAFIRQIQQYDIAVTNHQTKYNTWPGDDDLYVAAGRGSNAIKNDGLISDDDGAQNTNVNYQENRYYFPELRALDGLVVENCPQIDSGSSSLPIVSGPNCNNPLGKIGKNNMIFVFANQLGSASYPGNYYFFVDCSQMALGYFSEAPGCGMPFTGAEALAYDTKIDDGIANTGKILGFYNTPFSLMSFSPSGTASYNVSTSGRTYIMVQKVAPDIQR